MLLATLMLTRIKFIQQVQSFINYNTFKGSFIQYTFQGCYNHIFKSPVLNTRLQLQIQGEYILNIYLIFNLKFKSLFVFLLQVHAWVNYESILQKCVVGHLRATCDQDFDITSSLSPPGTPTVPKSNTLSTNLLK